MISKGSLMIMMGMLRKGTLKPQDTVKALALHRVFENHSGSLEVEGE